MAFKTVIRIAKLGSMGNIKASGEHTWRERKTDNADPERTPLNEDWREVKSAAELVEAVQQRVAQAQQKSDHAVPCIEYLITANKDAFKEGGGEVDSTKYFADSLKWLEAKHGKENIVAVNIQRDEQAPHMVAYVVPLVEVEAKTRKRSVVVGKDAEGKQIRELREYKEAATVRLSASEFFDSRQKLRDLQTDFSRDVGQKHGLERGIQGSKAKHQTIKKFYTDMNETQKSFDGTMRKRNSRISELETSDANKTAKISQLERDLKASRKSEDGLINDVLALKKEVGSLKLDTEYTKERMKQAFHSDQVIKASDFARKWAEHLPSTIAIVKEKTAKQATQDAGKTPER